MLSYTNLGVIPMATIAAKILGMMVTQRIAAGMAAAQVAAEFEYFKDMKETQVQALAIELERNTDTPYWEWFIILRNLQEYGVFQTPAGKPEIPIRSRPPMPQYIPKPESKIGLYVAIGVGALALMLIMGR